MGDPSIRVTIRSGTSTRLPEARNDENVLSVQPGRRSGVRRERAIRESAIRDSAIRDLSLFLPDYRPAISLELLFWNEDIPDTPRENFPPPRTKTCTQRENGTNCRICFNDVVTNDVITDLPCNHIFHKDCMDRWREYKHECPLCRGPLYSSLTHSLSE